MSMFKRNDDEYYGTELDPRDDDRTIFHRNEDEHEHEEVEDSNMFSCGRKDMSILGWLCSPVWTGDLEE